MDSSALDDIVRVTEGTLGRIQAVLERLDSSVRISISAPTIPLPPIFQTPGWLASPAELRLDRALMSFLAKVAGTGRAIVNSRRLADESPAVERFDLKSELLLGFPYAIRHAEAMGSAPARLLAPRASKKGVITDLDDTLWHGLAGEVGPEGIRWDLHGSDHLHGLYQNLLFSLAQEGVLIGVASKNDPAVVDRCFKRTDLLLHAENVFPLEVHWEPKSGSVERILRTWNIAADSVVFVDDSAMELAEVAAAHPGIECIQFPKGDYTAGMRMLSRLRDLCAKESASPEDALRMASIRRGAEFREHAEETGDNDRFLAEAGAKISFDFRSVDSDARVLELVNKTNQFNAAPSLVSFHSGDGIAATCSFVRIRTGSASRTYSVRVPQWPYPVYVRGGESTDAMVLYELLATDEYSIIKGLESPATIIDAGANIGLASVYFLNRYPSSHVLAIEPFPDSFELCRRNLAAYGDRAAVLMGALWPNPGRVDLDPQGEEWANRVKPLPEGATGGVEAIAMPSLITLCGGSVDLLKIDVEGSEKEIFEPAARSWLPNVRNLVIELHDQECSRRVFGVLDTYEYEMTNRDRVYYFRNLRVNVQTGAHGLIH